MDAERIKAEIVLLKERLQKSTNPFQAYAIERMIARREAKLDDRHKDLERSGNPTDGDA